MGLAGLSVLLHSPLRTTVRGVPFLQLATASDPMLLCCPVLLKFDALHRGRIEGRVLICVVVVLHGIA